MEQKKIKTEQENLPLTSKEGTICVNKPQSII